MDLGCLFLYCFGVTIDIGIWVLNGGKPGRFSLLYVNAVGTALFQIGILRSKPNRTVA